MPVRHDLSRALLVSVAAGGGQGVRASRPAVFDVERTADAWRLAARPCLPCGSRRHAHRSASRGAGRGARRRARPARRLRGFRRGAWSTSSARLLEFLIGREARRENGRRLRRAGQGQHAAQLLRHRTRTAAPTRSIAARTSRAASCPGSSIPILAPRADLRDAARLRAHPAVEPEGRDHRPDARRSATGAAGSWSPIPNLQVI